MLHLIGIGAKKEHINFEMFEKIKGCDEVFLEYYTSFYQTSFDDLEKFLGKKVIVANRDLVESQIEDRILNPAKKKDVALLVLGDPLIATTHNDLLLRAKKMGVKTAIYNNVSIGNYITRTGLQFYKFGKITSIPFFSEKFMPRTPYLVFSDNCKIGAHSLFLLDLNPSGDVAYKGCDKYLNAYKALEFMLEIPKLMVREEEIDEKDAQCLNEDSQAVICSRLGFDDEKIFYGTIADLIKFDKKEVLKEPLCVIIPGDMHEMEEEFLNQYKI